MITNHIIGRRRRKNHSEIFKTEEKNKFVKALLKMIGWNLSGGWSRYQD